MTSEYLTDGALSVSRLTCPAGHKCLFITTFSNRNTQNDQKVKQFQTGLGKYMQVVRK